MIFQAKDSDGPTQGGGQVFYSIKSVNTDATVFNIDPISGEILVKFLSSTLADDNANLLPGNTKGGSITVPLTSCLTGMD